MSKKTDEDVSLALWIPEHRIVDYEAKGYIASDPQPSMNDEQKRYRGGSVHMKKENQ